MSKVDLNLLDLSGLVFGYGAAKHLSGALVRVNGIDVVVTARHLGAQKDQQVLIGGNVYTFDSVKGVDVAVTSNTPNPDWKKDRLFNGDLAVATLKETVPAHITRYELSSLSAGIGYMFRADRTISTFSFQRHTSFRQWTRGSYLKPIQFIAGDSGRPILIFDKKTGKTLLHGVLSRQWWGEWLRLYSTISVPD